jgi:hypothetical protein
LRGLNTRSQIITGLGSMGNGMPSSALNTACPGTQWATWGQTLLCNTSMLGHASIHSMHSHMNFGWLTLGTREMNDGSLVLYCHILHLERQHLTVSHCLHLL